MNAPAFSRGVGFTALTACVQKSESEMSVLEDDPPPVKKPRKKADNGVRVWVRMYAVPLTDNRLVTE